jgi:hypothetical protein
VLGCDQPISGSSDLFPACRGSPDLNFVNQLADNQYLWIRTTFMTTECNRIAFQLTSTINGEAWYGDSLREILENVTAIQAQAHPIANAHSIWELLYHIEAWVKFALGAVEGTPIPPWPAMPVELDWPPVNEISEQAWKQAVESFFSTHLKLVEAIKTFGDEKLDATVPGSTYNFYRLFQSTTQHAVYHSGQIALLKKIASA